MKFSRKMCLMIILEVTKNQSFILSLEDTFFEKPQRGEGFKLTLKSAVLGLMLLINFQTNLKVCRTNLILPHKYNSVAKLSFVSLWHSK